MFIQHIWYMYELNTCARIFNILARILYPPAHWTAVDSKIFEHIEWSSANSISLRTFNVCACVKHMREYSQSKIQAISARALIIHSRFLVLRVHSTFMRMTDSRIDSLWLFVINIYEHWTLVCGLKYLKARSWTQHQCVLSTFKIETQKTVFLAVRLLQKTVFWGKKIEMKKIFLI